MMTIVWKDGAEGRLVAGGKALEYGCFGPGPESAPTIVLLHEGLGCLALWRDFPARLAEATGWGVFAYSRAGYGRSEPAPLPRPLDYMTREAIDVLPDVLDGIGFLRGVLMGHSDGATIASEYAGGLEDFRVRGLILMAPHFFTEEMGLAAISGAGTTFREGDLRGRMEKYHDDVEGAFTGWHDSWMHPDFNQALMTDALDYLRIPSLAIQGRDDEYGTLAQIEELDTRSYAPVEQLVLDDCGHAPHLDQPEQVLAAVSEFLTRLERIENADVEAA